MKLKTSDNRNISVSSVNGYTVEKVKRAKQYLDEIGSNKRHFDFKRLVAMYNDIKGTNESPNGCSCQSPKYYNGILNYYNYGKLTLINNGYKESDFEDKKEEEPAPIENEEKRINLGNEESVSEALKEDEGAVVKDEEDKASDEPKNDVVEKKKAGRPKKNS
jgi:hypothetical protein